MGVIHHIRAAEIWPYTRNHNYSKTSGSVDFNGFFDRAIFAPKPREKKNFCGVEPLRGVVKASGACDGVNLGCSAPLRKIFDMFLGVLIWAYCVCLHVFFGDV